MDCCTYRTRGDFLRRLAPDCEADARHKTQTSGSTEPWDAPKLDIQPRDKERTTVAAPQAARRATHRAADPSSAPESHAAPARIPASARLPSAARRRRSP